MCCAIPLAHVKMPPCIAKYEKLWQSLKMQWTPFEHSFYRHLQAHELEAPLGGKKLLLALSGGLDSMVLLNLFKKFSSTMKFQLSVAHIHHGPSDQVEQKKFRNEALEFAKNAAGEIPFYWAGSQNVLKSESEMRDFRKSELEKIRQKQNLDLIVYAHHEDDFMETQLLRLIRGTGPEALEPMFFHRGVELRPLLKTSRKDLENYAKEQKISHLEDPSNPDPQYLRNWLRNQWLPALEDKCPGATRSLSRSLSLLSEKSAALPQELIQENRLSRAVYASLSPIERRQALAHYLRFRGQVQFTKNHVEEIYKHLDISQNEHSFKVAQMLWKTSRDWIFAEPAFLVQPN